MLKQKRLKKLLGTGYRFEQKLSAEDVTDLLERLEGGNHFRIAAALAVGAVKLEAVVYWSNGKYNLGYLYAQQSQDYFPRVITSTLKGIMADSTNKISRILFKLAVEQAITMNVVAATCNISREQLEKLRGTCVSQVKRTNGSYAFEDAFDFQKR